MQKGKRGNFSFSEQVPHGDSRNNPITVMMTKIEEDFIFVHASDIQLFNNVELI